jgi:hypothetical protein
MRLIRIYELATVIRAERATGRLDWNDVIAMLERTGAARFTFPALTLVEDLAPQTVDARRRRRASEISQTVLAGRVRSARRCAARLGRSLASDPSRDSAVPCAGRALVATQSRSSSARPPPTEPRSLAALGMTNQERSGGPNNNSISATWSRENKT